MPRIVFKSGILSLFSLLLACPQILLADLSVDLLKQAREASELSGDKSAFDQEAKAFSEAIALSSFQPQSRAKLPGSFVPYLETGFHILRVNNTVLKDFVATSSKSTPDFFHGLFLKGGTGLPFGFNVEGGVSQLISEHKSTSVYATVSNQILDFANIVYIDLVPSMTLSGSVMRTVAGPALYSFSGQAIVGAYHRQTLSQLGIIVQYAYTLLTALDPSIGNHFFRYGVMTNIPVIKGTFLRTEVFYPSMSATISTGYEF